MKKHKIEIKWAFIYAAMFLLWMTLEKLTGLHDRYLEQQQTFTTLILIPSIFIYVLTLLDKKKNFYGGNMTYKQSFISGLMLTIFMVILSPINQLITSYVISPDYFANEIEYTVRKGMFTQQQAEQQFNVKNYIIISIVAGLITGAAFSAIISLFTRSKNQQSWVRQTRSTSF
jgi:hypothetical protein